MLNKKTWEISLLKFENAEIFYITPKNQLWAIFNTGLKKCIKKSLTDVKKLGNFFENKNFITYKDSKKIKKGIKFKLCINGVEIYFKKKKIHIEFLNKQNIITLIDEFKYKKKIPLITNYSEKDIFLSNVEGLNFLKTTVANNSVDLILTDPPYLISKKTGFNDLSKNKINLLTPYSKKYAFQTIFEWDSNFDLNILELFIKEYYLKLKSGGTLIIFFDLWKITYLKNMLEKYKFKQIRFIEWVKKNPVPINTKTNYLSNCREIALVAVKGKNPTFNSSYDKGIYEFPIEQRNRFHPNQKNLNLFENLILKHSNENDLILDTFLGSGVSAIACKNTKRKFIGCELEKKYFDKTIKWLKK